MKGGKKDGKPGQTECFEKTLNGFNMQANRAIFTGTVMIMLTGDQSFGGNDQKGNADRQAENKYFPGEARFHRL